MKFGDDEFRTLIFQAEVAALLHDIGKFTWAFIEKGTKGHGLGPIHTEKFYSQHCIGDLLRLLKDSPIDTCLNVPGTDRGLKFLGDLLRWHHERNDEKLKEYFGAGAAKDIPMLLYLIIYADTVDSASSKGGAAFNRNRSRLDSSPLLQNLGKFYLATPFGEPENWLSEEQCEKNTKEFQKKLYNILKEFHTKCNELSWLIERRQELLLLMEEYLSASVADTRLPTNDVSLWQHSYYTASLFKAMMARHLLTQEYRACDDRGNLVYFKEHLGILGVCWKEDDLIARCYRPTEIVGWRKRLDEVVQKIKKEVETESCLGNEIYRDRDGIYFIVPSYHDSGKGSEGHKSVKDALDALLPRFEYLLNSDDTIPGDLAWEARYKDVGLNILGLADVLKSCSGSGVEILRTGPAKPVWLCSWKNIKEAKEVCARCKVRPITFSGTSAGSEGDKQRRCDVCEQMAEIGRTLRQQAKFDEPQTKRLIGTDSSAKYWTFDIKKLLKDKGNGDDEHTNRLALVQGIFDLRPFLSGTAFSNLLVNRPQDFSVMPEVKDQSQDIATWDSMLKAAEDAWKQVQNAGPGNMTVAKDTLRQIFQDKYLFSAGDGRADGKDGIEKAVNYLRHTVIDSSFAPELGFEHGRLINYALCQHPAPSRLARMWETTARSVCSPLRWCEGRKVHYSPISLDCGQFMVLVPASCAWDLILDTYNEYCRSFARVRHLLPLHLSATAFYYKSPLYIAIDAARRFSRLGLGRSAEWWKFKERKTEGDRYILCWEAPEGKKVRWKVPRMLPNGREDRFFTWFWPESGRHPVHVSEIENGVTYRVYPSTFDYEVLDATVRRYDIRFLPGKTCRPHSFVRHGGPRPYRLSDLEVWQGLDSVVEGVEKHQQKILIELLARLHRDWHDSQYKVERRSVSRDAVRIFLRPEKNEDFDVLARMAEDGSIFDLFEWRDLIRNVQSQPTQ